MTILQAPELQTSHWFNTSAPITLDNLLGRVVLIEAFQMLCPGCVSHGLPQAKRVGETFSPNDVCVIGLHTVFEHHAAQGTVEALEAFLHEYRITFPVAIDVPSENGGAPKTMADFNMQGTPTLVLLDKKGMVRQQHFGRRQDIVVGADVMALVCEGQRSDPQVERSNADHCDENGCLHTAPAE